MASGYVADGNRQLVRNPEFREPAVKRLAEVSDSLFWSLPLTVSTATRQRRVGGPPASFILFHGVRHVHNTVHKAILPTAHPDSWPVVPVVMTDIDAGRAGAASGLERPTELVRCGRGGSYDLAGDSAFHAERMKARVRTAPVNHMPMLTAPSAVVDIVLEAAREAIEDRSVEVPALLGDRGQHRAPSVPDLIIAATAKLAGLTVLHVDEVKKNRPSAVQEPDLPGPGHGLAAGGAPSLR